MMGNAEKCCYYLCASGGEFWVCWWRRTPHRRTHTWMASHHCGSACELWGFPSLWTWFHRCGTGRVWSPGGAPYAEQGCASPWRFAGTGHRRKVFHPCAFVCVSSGGWCQETPGCTHHTCTCPPAKNKQESVNSSDVRKHQAAHITSVLVHLQKTNRSQSVKPGDIRKHLTAHVPLRKTNRSPSVKPGDLRKHLAAQVLLGKINRGQSVKSGDIRKLLAAHVPCVRQTGVRQLNQLI